MQTGIIFTADESLSKSYGMLPADEYKVRITECKYEPTSDKLGTSFNFKYTVVEGEYMNRTLSDNAVWTWNEEHKKAIEFGHYKFNQILLAIGHPHFAGDTNELLGGEMIVNVEIREYEAKDGTKKQTNSVNDWRKVSDGMNTVTNSATQPISAGPKPSFGSGSPIPRPSFGRN